MLQVFSVLLFALLCSAEPRSTNAVAEQIIKNAEKITPQKSPYRKKEMNDLSKYFVNRSPYAHHETIYEDTFRDSTKNLAKLDCNKFKKASDALQKRSEFFLSELDKVNVADLHMPVQVSQLQRQQELFLGIILNTMRMAPINRKVCGSNPKVQVEISKALKNSLQSALEKLKENKFKNKGHSKAVHVRPKGDAVDDTIKIEKGKRIYLGPIHSPNKRVITGVRFREQNKVVYLQIETVETLRYGLINPATIKWNETLPADLATNNHSLKKDKLLQSIVELDQKNKQYVLTGVQFIVHKNKGGRIDLTGFGKKLNYATDGKVEHERKEKHSKPIEQIPMSSLVQGFSPSAVSVKTTSRGISLALDSDENVVVPRLIANNMGEALLQV